MDLLPYWMDSLTPEMVRIAEIELGETPETKEATLKDLKEKIDEEPDFYPRMDEAFLLRFLRCAKFNVEKAFKTLKRYYSFKARYSRILMDYKPSELQHVLEMNNLIALPKRDPQGVGIGLIRLGCFDLDKVTAEEIFACIMVCTDIGLEPPATQVCGYRIIMDMTDFGFKMVKVASPSLLYRIVQVVQDCIPCRIKGYHLVHDGILFSAVYAILKPFLSEKLASRVHLHGEDLKSLQQFIPAEALPDELGGTMGSLDYKEYNKMILSREQHFINIIQYGFKNNIAKSIKDKESDILET